MKTLILISRCLEVRKRARSASSAVFHFRGVYRGEKIKEVCVYLEDCARLVDVGEEYILYLSMEKIDKQIMYARSLRVKRLDGVRYN